MRRGRSTGKRTHSRQARPAAINGIGRIDCRHAFLMFDDVRTELWEVASANRRWVWPCQYFQ